MPPELVVEIGHNTANWKHFLNSTVRGTSFSQGFSVPPKNYKSAKKSKPIHLFLHILHLLR
ncbi:MAG: hypothetical protein CK532_05545 [Flavobacteriales bacterium]|nr:MAG: hypothetical protein CK532_05545 [Flavobacteriales bacterium]